MSLEASGHHWFCSLIAVSTFAFYRGSSSFFFLRFCCSLATSFDMKIKLGYARHSCYSVEVI